MNFVVFLKTHGNIDLNAIKKYHNTIGSNKFSVLHNGKKLTYTFFKHCSWTFYEYEKRYPFLKVAHENLDVSRQVNINNKWYSAHFAILAPLMLFISNSLTGTCNSLLYDKKLTNIWSLESDTYFKGNPLYFFEDFKSNNEDLLSTGFATVDSGWWGYNLHTKMNITEKNHKYSNFNCIYKNLLKKCQYDDCNILNAKNGCDSMSYGYLFRLVIVERFSHKLLYEIEKYLQAGQAMAGEAFASSVCDLKPDCTLGDWQLLLNKKYMARDFIWYPIPGVVNRRLRVQPNNWAHPIKAFSQTAIKSNLKKKSLPFSFNFLDEFNSLANLKKGMNVFPNSRNRFNNNANTESLLLKIYDLTVAKEDLTCVPDTSKKTGMVVTAYEGDIPANFESYIIQNRLDYTKHNRYSNAIYKLQNKSNLKKAVQILSLYDASWSNMDVFSYLRWSKLIIIYKTLVRKVCDNSWIFWLDSDALFLETTSLPTFITILLSANDEKDPCSKYASPEKIPKPKGQDINSGAWGVANTFAGKLFVYSILMIYGRTARKKIYSKATFDAQENNAFQDWMSSHSVYNADWYTTTSFNSDAYNWKPGNLVLHLNGGDDLVHKYNHLLEIVNLCKNVYSDKCKNVINMFSEIHNNKIMKPLFNIDVLKAKQSCLNKVSKIK